jgi:hypothetical protein
VGTAVRRIEPDQRHPPAEDAGVLASAQAPANSSRSSKMSEMGRALPLGFACSA